MRNAVANKNWKPAGQLSTPFQKAGQLWDTRMGAAIVQARNWRVAFFCCLGALTLSIGGLIYLGSQPKLVPHIVHLDRLGAPTYVGPLAASRDARPTEAAVRYHLRRFIMNTRSLSSDLAIVKQNWIEAYASITQVAANQLGAYADATNPMERAKTVRMSVEVSGLVPISQDTWQADWRELQTDTHGVQVGESSWRGTFRVLVKSPRDEGQIAMNPLGIFIDEFHWSKLQ
jgi:type IV secretion system protein TrbF